MFEDGENSGFYVSLEFEESKRKFNENFWQKFFDIPLKREISKFYYKITKFLN